MGDALPFVDLGPGRSALAVSAGSEHTCALLDDGKVRCWGSNQLFQLDRERTGSFGVFPGDMGVGLAIGLMHACALLADGTVRCWGYNNAGPSGYGDGAPHEILMGDATALPPVDLGF